jgi:myo-inositol-1(or 4)-monophosphatase
MLGSAAIDLAWLADGTLDASVTLSNNPWDMAAGVIIAREAGAQVLDDDATGHTSRSTATIAAGPALVRPVLELISGAPFPERRLGRW